MVLHRYNRLSHGPRSLHLLHRIYSIQKMSLKLIKLADELRNYVLIHFSKITYFNDMQVGSTNAGNFYSGYNFVIFFNSGYIACGKSSTLVFPVQFYTMHFRHIWLKCEFEKKKQTNANSTK